MKHYFLANPKSGKNRKGNLLEETIRPAAERAQIDYEIYETTGPGDATRFVRETCTAADGEPVRFYAVGGDGTLYEVVNGAYGFPNAEITVIPTGSGNDYIRMYGGEEPFLDVDRLIAGAPIAVDALKVTDQDGREEIAINQASMGFDAEACSKQASMKSLPGVIGHMTYVFGGLYCMFTKVYHRFHVTVDGAEQKGPFIQCTVWNGKYYGSGILGGTFSDPTDGMLEVSVVHRYMSWPRLFPFMLLHWQQKFDFYRYPWTDTLRGKKVVIESPKPAAVNVDGECRPVTACTFEILPKAFRFVLPEGTELPRTDTRIDPAFGPNTVRKKWARRLSLFDLLVNRLGHGDSI